MYTTKLAGNTDRNCAVIVSDCDMTNELSISSESCISRWDILVDTCSELTCWRGRVRRETLTTPTDLDTQ